MECVIEKRIWSCQENCQITVLILNGTERVPVSLEQSYSCGTRGEEEQVAGKSV